MSRRRVILAVLIGCTLFTIAIFGVWMLERYFYQASVPPQKVSTLDSFLQWRKSVQGFEILQSGSDQYLMATARSGRIISGSSGYVFDRTGRLIDWSPDTMDDYAFQTKWQSMDRKPGSVTLE